MKWRLLYTIWLPALLAAAALSVVRTPSAVRASAVTPRVGVLAYFAPGQEWKQLEDGAPAVGVAVMNPANGPGAAKSSDYVVAVASAQRSHVAVFGYVHTSYGERSQADVKADVDRYFAWYGVNGIFFDEVSIFCDFQSYWQTLYDYVKTTYQATVMLDPGWVSLESECYLKSADMMVTFEGSFDTYLHGFPVAPWTLRYPAARFWHLIYDVPNLIALKSAQALSRARHAGFAFVTPSTLPNPWESLPTGDYWDAELAGPVCHGVHPTMDEVAALLVADGCVPRRGTVGRTLSFSATATAIDVDTPADIVYNWSFGDGQTARGQNVTHTYATAGSYSVSVTAVSSGNPQLSDRDEDSITVVSPGMSTVTLVAATPADVASRDYAAGWNMVAAPSGFGFPPAAGTLFTLPPAGGEYQTLAAGGPVEGGRAYWASFATPARVTLSGTPRAETVVGAKAGTAAMIGNPNPQQYVTVEGAVAVLVWDPVAAQYVQTNTLAPGQGAWVFMPQEAAAP